MGSARFRFADGGDTGRIEPTRSKKLVIVTRSGVVTFNEIMDHFEKLSKDSRCRAPMKKLVDYRHVEHFEISMDDSSVID